MFGDGVITSVMRVAGDGSLILLGLGLSIQPTWFAVRWGGHADVRKCTVMVGFVFSEF